MILIECNADECLVKSLFTNLRNEEYSHSGNKSELIKRMLNFADGTGSVGLIDADPGSNPPAYFDRYNLIEHLEDFDIDVYKASNNSILVSLYPNLEGWIIRTSNFSHINLINFNLPNEERALHKIINSKLDKFNELLIELNNSKYLQALKAKIAENL